MRYDSISPEVTPKIQSYLDCCFTQYLNHYSASNGTAKALFGLFFSLPAIYMDSFSHARITPLFLDLLEHRGYQIEVLAKENMEHFGTDETIFRKHKIKHRLASESAMIDDALAILDARKEQKNPPPLFIMVFHGAPHNHQFSHENYRKFLPDDYMPLFDPSNPDHRLKASNQFKNAFNYVDDEAGRFLDALKAQGYFENSIIIITGDHGHEEYEHGHWGHNSAFTKEQTKVHFSIHTPQQNRSQTSNLLTSHMDIVPTVLEEMGESLPLEQFTVGTSMFDPKPRDFIVLSGHANRVLFDGRIKIDHTPFEGIAYYRVTDEDDEPVADSDSVLERYTPLLLKMFEQMGRFYQ